MSFSDCLRVAVLVEFCDLAVADGKSHDPVRLKHPVCGFHFRAFPTDHQNTVTFCHKFAWLEGQSFRLESQLLEEVRYSVVPAISAGKRELRTGNNPLNILRQQRQQTLDIATSECRVSIFYQLHVLLCAHRDSSALEFTFRPFGGTLIHLSPLRVN